MGKAEITREFGVAIAHLPVHRLQEEVLEREPLETLRFHPRLGENELQFIALALQKPGAGLGTDADPVDAARRRQRAVGLDRDLEAGVMEGIDQVLVELQQRLTELERANDSLRVWAEALETDSATIERLARERYGMIRPGEILYRMTPPTDSIQDVKRP